MGQVTGSHGANGIPVHCNESHRMAVVSHKFDFECLAFAMHEHNGAHIAMLQTLLRHVSGQDHGIQFINFFHSFLGQGVGCHEDG